MLDNIEHLLLSEDEVKAIKVWHLRRNNDLIGYLPACIRQLSFHSLLLSKYKVALLTDIEFLKTVKIRQDGLATMPKEWISPGTLEVDRHGLDELWIRPSNHARAKKRSISPIEERMQERLTKLQASIEDKKVAIYLGRQNQVYKALQVRLNKAHQEVKQFVSDHVWFACGYIERGVKISDNWLSVIQAMETVRRMPELDVYGDAIEKREIAFCLDGYDCRHAMAAMYSNPNRIERLGDKPKIQGIKKFEFAFTGLTDLELSNIVRNREWFDLLAFYRTGEDGEAEHLSKIEVAKNYGIVYIGDVMRNAISHK